MSVVVFDHLELCRRLLDERRIEPYARALAAHVKPGSVVADIGAGLGVLTALACRYGARKVYAIDALSLIHLAREVVAANGCADRVEFIQKDVHRVTLPELADVVICDVRSILPESQIATAMDARRLLVPGGSLLPRLDRLWAAVVVSPEKYEQIAGPWLHHPLGINAEPALRRGTQTWIARRFTPDEFISTPAEWATIDYRRTNSSNLSGRCDTRVTRGATAHGVCVWFESELEPGISFSSRPEGRTDDYGAAFFPWPHAVTLKEDDIVSVSFDGRFSPSGHTWEWRTSVRSSTGVEKVAFTQGMPRPGGPDVAGAISRDDMRVDRHVLDALERGVAVGVVADQLLDRFPASLHSRRDALTRVGRLSARYE